MTAHPRMVVSIIDETIEELLALTPLPEQFHMERAFECRDFPYSPPT
jgi:hypothetical protein